MPFILPLYLQSVPVHSVNCVILIKSHVGEPTETRQLHAAETCLGV
jgi:hypothetical protein